LALESSLLQETSEKYAEAVKNHFIQITEIDKLRIHVKLNILYYMQSIWTFENADQRFFRIKDILVPDFDITYNVTGFVRFLPPPLIVSSAPSHPDEKKHCLRRVNYKVAKAQRSQRIVRLHEIADLGNLIGFKGNYRIFPLQDHNAITDLLLQDYVDETFGGISDPDILGKFTTEELIKTMRMNYKKLKPEEKPRAKKLFENALKLKLTNANPETEEIVVPSNSLYIEALLGTHTLLEPFKHREVDVLKAKQELVSAKLENLRKSARMLNDNFEDEIDKQIIVKGNGDATVTNVET